MTLAERKGEESIWALSQNEEHMITIYDRKEGMGEGFLDQNPFLEIVHIAGSQNRPFLRM